MKIYSVFSFIIIIFLLLHLKKIPWKRENRIFSRSPKNNNNNNTSEYRKKNTRKINKIMTTMKNKTPGNNQTKRKLQKQDTHR